jgi:hypothetical protein
MIATRGYEGSTVQVRRYVRTVRPTGKREASLILSTLPGEHGQVDWANELGVIEGEGVDSDVAYDGGRRSASRRPASSSGASLGLAVVGVEASEDRQSCLSGFRRRSASTCAM